MEAQEIIEQLQAFVPQLSDAFTDNVDVASVTRNGTVLTIQCGSVHEAEVNDIVSLTGAVTPLDVASIDRVLTLLTVVTTLPHDITYNAEVEDPPTFTIEGANESEFNVTHTVKQVVNRNTLTVTVVDSGSTSGTGTMTLLGGANHFQGYNLPYKIQSILSPTSFTVNHPQTAALNPVGVIKARIGPRISGGVSIDRMIAAYTEQKSGEYWLQVVLEDVDASRDLKSRGDGVVDRAGVVNRTQKIQNPFSVFLFVPAADDLSAREARDIAQRFFRTMSRSLVGHRFDSGLADTEQGAVGFHSHGFQDYTPAVYVHRYSFLQMVDLTFEDTVGAPKSVAFRNMSLTLTPSTGEATISTTNIDLDDTPN